MKLNNWLAGDRGRLTALAAHFGLTQSAVSQWRTSGVPVARMKAVRDFTEGEVTLEDMLPDAQAPQATARSPFATPPATTTPQGDQHAV